MTETTVALGDIAQFVRGVTFKPSDVNDDGVGIMRTKNVQADLDLSDIVRVPPRLVKRDEQYLHESDILISSANSWYAVGRACWVPQLSEPLAIGGFVTGLRNTSSFVDSRFLFQWFTSPRVQATLRSFSNKTTNISNLNLRLASAMPFTFPGLEEQLRIVGILDQADALRTKRRQNLAHLDTLAQSIFHAMFGDSTRTQTVPLSDVAEVTSGITKGRRTSSPTSPVPYLAVANVQAGHLRLDSVKTIDATAKEIDRYALRSGDLVLTEGGDPDKLGRGTVWRNEIPLCLHQNHIFRVRTSAHADVTPEFLAAFIASRSARTYFRRSAKQTTGIASINMRQLKALPVTVPSMASQAQFARRIRATTERIRTVERALAADDELFASLQARAFRGEL